MSESVKTYRVLHYDGLRVGDEVRQPGDYIPEAADWDANVRQSYLNTRYIEDVVILKSELDKWLADRKKKATKKKVAKTPTPDNEGNKKTPAKKRTVKKTTTSKKGKNNGRLAEQSV